MNTARPLLRRSSWNLDIARAIGWFGCPRRAYGGRGSEALRLVAAQFRRVLATRLDVPPGTLSIGPDALPRGRPATVVRL
jgi:hypothetical protein